jgi:8-oxo-dGTP pyrophosphatase MutT (NUDIX family)
VVLLKREKDRLKELLKQILDRELSYSSQNPAAILFPLMIEDRVKLVMIMRQKNLRRSAGHIAFPGGIREETETPVETALREAEEELGIKASEVEIPGYLSPKVVIESRIKIHPVVGVFDSQEIIPDTYEVRRVLVDDLMRVLKSRKIADWGPNFECGGELVWGASSRILDDFYLRIIKNFGSVSEFERAVYYTNG